MFHVISKTFEENEKCDLQEILTPGEVNKNLFLACIQSLQFKIIHSFQHYFMQRRINPHILKYFEMGKLNSDILEMHIQILKGNNFLNFFNELWLIFYFLLFLNFIFVDCYA